MVEDEKEQKEEGSEIDVSEDGLESRYYPAPGFDVMAEKLIEQDVDIGGIIAHRLGGPSEQIILEEYQKLRQGGDTTQQEMQQRNQQKRSQERQLRQQQQQ